VLCAAVIALALAGAASAAGPTHEQVSFSGENNIPAGKLCNFDYHNEFTIYFNDIIFDDPNNPTKIIEEATAYITHVNVDTGHTLTEIDWQQHLLPGKRQRQGWWPVQLASTRSKRKDHLRRGGDRVLERRGSKGDAGGPRRLRPDLHRARRRAGLAHTERRWASRLVAAHPCAWAFGSSRLEVDSSGTHSRPPARLMRSPEGQIILAAGVRLRQLG
jgi:hypothetical protein